MHPVYNSKDQLVANYSEFRNLERASLKPGTLLGIVDTVESIFVWQLDNHDAAKEVVRFYKEQYGINIWCKFAIIGDAYANPEFAAECATNKAHFTTSPS